MGSTEVVRAVAMRGTQMGAYAAAAVVAARSVPTFRRRGVMLWRRIQPHLPGSSPLERRNMQSYQQLIDEADGLAERAAGEPDPLVAAIYHRQRAETLLIANLHLTCHGDSEGLN
jgi:hypothetical protein